MDVVETLNLIMSKDGAFPYSPLPPHSRLSYDWR